MPNSEGEILVEFESANQRYYFEKKIIVKSNAENSPSILKLKGYVVPNKSKYRYQIGDLKIKNQVVDFASFEHKDEIIRKISIMNDTDKDLNISFTEVPKLLSLNFSKIIKKNQSSEITISINSEVLKPEQLINSEIKMLVFDGVNTFSGSLIIKGFFNQNKKITNTEIEANSAKIVVEKDRYDIKPNSINKEISIKFENVGDSVLIIKKISGSKNIAVMSYDNEIDPGDIGEVSILSNPVRGRGNQFLTMFTNDVNNPRKTIRIIGNKLTELGKDRIEKIDLATTKGLIKKFKSMIIIDVRSKREFEKGHIKKAININISDPHFKDKIANLNKNRRYLVYCKAGSRSLRAVKIMQKLGFDKLYHFEDGYDEWIKEQ